MYEKHTHVDFCWGALWILEYYCQKYSILLFDNSITQQGRTDFFKFIIVDIISTALVFYYVKFSMLWLWVLFLFSFFPPFKPSTIKHQKKKKKHGKKMSSCYSHMFFAFSRHKVTYCLRIPQIQRSLKMWRISNSITQGFSLNVYTYYTSYSYTITLFSTVSKCWEKLWFIHTCFLGLTARTTVKMFFVSSLLVHQLLCCWTNLLPIYTDVLVLFFGDNGFYS